MHPTFPKRQGVKAHEPGDVFFGTLLRLPWRGKARHPGQIIRHLARLPAPPEGGFYEEVLYLQRKRPMHRDVPPRQLIATGGIWQPYVQHGDVVADRRYVVQSPLLEFFLVRRVRSGCREGMRYPGFNDLPIEVVVSEGPEALVAPVPSP